MALYAEIGYGPHRCVHCGHHVNWARGRSKGPDVLVVDHREGSRANNLPYNLAASCNGCNTSRADE
ncbi:MAG: hypothetical protein KDB40_11070 [Acidimicrobiales bacterium]|nr:hypothetical protein [Acidimicrobiales bacterium]MCB9393820.1 hypothetical protein [Acidimicrobiaceae bacterium]